MQPQVYRVSFLLVALVLTFLVPRIRWWRGAGAADRRSHDRSGAIDANQRSTGSSPVRRIAALAWPLVDFERFVYRAADPLAVDVVLGVG